MPAPTTMQDTTHTNDGGHRHATSPAADASDGRETSDADVAARRAAESDEWSERPATATRRSVVRALAAGAVVGASGLAVTPGSSQSGTLVVDDFADGWAAPGTNSLGAWTSAGDLANGGGTGAVVEPTSGDVSQALRLAYDASGWYSSRIGQTVSGYDRLEFVIRGDAGGEGSDVLLEVGGVEDTFANLADASIGTSFSTVGVDLASAGVDRSSVDDLWLEFWQGTGAVEIAAIRFVATGSGPPPLNGVQPTDPDDDGVYEDLNGNGEFDSDDVVTFFQNIDAEAIQNNASYYDANGNGNADFDDIVTLFQEL